MFSWFKRLAAPVAAIALLGLAASVKADTISFHTLGAFNGGAASNSVSITKPGFDSLGNLTLTFQGANVVGEELIPTETGGLAINVGFGVFTVSDDYLSGTGSQDYAVFSGTTFELTVVQDFPDPLSGGSNNTHPLTSKITGTISVQSNGATGSTLQIVFNGAVNNVVTFRIPGDGNAYPPTLNYEVDSLVKFVGGSSEASINGTISAVPLPGVAWAGMALFAMVGGAGGLKKRLRRRAA